MDKIDGLTKQNVQSCSLLEKDLDSRSFKEGTYDLRKS